MPNRCASTSRSSIVSSSARTPESASSGSRAPRRSANTAVQDSAEFDGAAHHVRQSVSWVPPWPANRAAGDNNTALAAQDLAAIQSTAATARDAYQQQAKLFTDPMRLWPQQVSADIKILSEADYEIISSYDALSHAASLDAANTLSFGDQSVAGAAAQRIRIALVLSADTSASCS